MLKPYRFLIAVAFLSGCATFPQDPAITYNRAVNDAAVAEENEISDRLFAINSANQALKRKDGKVLVVTWKSRSSFDANFKNQNQTSPQEKYVTWVTAAPQVQAFCQSFVRNNPNGDLNLRLKQYLGLNADWNYDVFVELWVDPADMFRPCVDPEFTTIIVNCTFLNAQLHQLKKSLTTMHFIKISISKVFATNLACHGRDWVIPTIQRVS